MPCISRKPRIAASHWATFGVLLTLCLIAGCDHREEPLLSPEASAQKQIPSLPKQIVDPVVDELPWSLLGKSIDSPEFDSFLKRNPEVPKRSFVEDYGTFVSFHETGLDLSSNLDGEIITIIAYGPEASHYGEYRSALPFTLKWSASRADAESVLGPPDLGAFYHSSVTDQDQFSADYAHLGIYLTYIASSEDDMQARLLDIRRKLPD